MKRITIGGKEYTIEFSLDATLYNECTEKVMDMITSVGMAEAEYSDEDKDAREKTEYAVNTVVKNISDIPQRALILFYAGLLENHGASGDNTVKSKADAKALMIQYLRENEGKSLYDVMNEMMQEIVNDHFFEMIGVDKMMENANKEVSRQVKTPQDHLKKAGNN